MIYFVVVELHIVAIYQPKDENKLLIMSGHVQWRRFAFFEKESVCENVESELSGKVTCAICEGGSLFLGDENGVIIMADRSFKVIWKHKVFRGSVSGIAYIYDTSNNNKQFIITIGDESIKSDSSNSSSLLYVIKVRLIHTFFYR